MATPLIETKFGGPISFPGIQIATTDTLTALGYYKKKDGLSRIIEENNWFVLCFNKKCSRKKISMELLKKLFHTKNWKVSKTVVIYMMYKQHNIERSVISTSSIQSNTTYAPSAYINVVTKYLGKPAALANYLK